MKRMMAKRRTHKSIATGADEVLFGVSLPSGSRINNIRATFNLSSNLITGLITGHMYAIEGWILPVHDPDLADTYEDIWDALVPKDTDVDTLDLDTEALDTTPFYEPGEADLSGLFEVGLVPERIYHRHQLVTLTSGHASMFVGVTAADVEQWMPADNFRLSIKKNYAIMQPSVLVFGCASPSLDDTTTTLPTAMAENEWARIKYIGDTLSEAMKDVLGLVEPGAETPWEEATDLLRKHLEPDLLEESAGQFAGSTWQVFSQAVIDHSVTGEISVNTITTG